MLLTGDVFRQPGRCDVWQPVEDRVARDTADSAVRVEVPPGDFLGVEFQYHIGAADIAGGITATGIRPIDHNWVRHLAQHVHWMEVAVAQTVAIRRVLEAIEQGLLSWLVEKYGSGDARRQPSLKRAELVRRVGMNACVQACEDLKILV